MAKAIQWFVESLVERFIPLVGSMFSSTVETFQALGLAEQQSQLEEAARQYEADGKTDIAATLRARASQLSSDDPAAKALNITDNIAARPSLLAPDENSPAAETPRLTQSKKSSSKPRRQKASTTKDTPNGSVLPPINPKCSE